MTACIQNIIFVVAAVVDMVILANAHTPPYKTILAVSASYVCFWVVWRALGPRHAHTLNTKVPRPLASALAMAAHAYSYHRFDPAGFSGPAHIFMCVFCASLMVY